MQINYELIGNTTLDRVFLAFKIGRFEQKLETLEQKQDKHNNLIERTYRLENSIGVLQEQVKVENHRIEDLEDIQNECIRKRT